MINVFTHQSGKIICKWFTKLKKYFTINLPDYIEEATAFIHLLRVSNTTPMFESEVSKYQWGLVEDVNHFPLVRFRNGRWEQLHTRLSGDGGKVVGEKETYGKGVAIVEPKVIQGSYLAHLVGPRFWEKISIYPEPIMAVILNAMFFREDLHRLKSNTVDIANPDDVLELAIEDADFLGQVLINAQYGEDKIGKGISSSHFTVNSAHPNHGEWVHETKMSDGLFGALIKLQQLNLKKEPVIYVSER